MAKLYEMTEQVQALFDLLSNDEIDQQTYNDTMESMGVLEKVNGYCQIINQFKYDIDVYSAEIDRLSKRKKSMENKIEWLKGQLMNFYEANGSKPIKVGTFKVSSRPSEQVEIDEDKLPKKWFVVTKKPDKKSIKATLKQGKKIKGATLTKKGNIQIR